MICRFSLYANFECLLDTATADQFTIFNGGTTMSQQYVGPKNFTIVPQEVAV